MEAEPSRILVVEDEEHLRDGLKMNLEMENYQVTTVDDGDSALTAFRSGRFDLIILDVMLPNLNGLDVCQTIRLEDPSIPIMFLSAKSSVEDRVLGLKTGADDYMVKPFNLEEFQLKVRILLQRNRSRSVSAEMDEYTIGDAKIDFKSYTVSRGGDVIYDLSQKEAKLLRLLISKKSEVVSRAKILDHVWGVDVYPTTRTIDNFILTFRKLFEKDSRNPEYFLSVRGVGYKFESNKQPL